MHLIRRLVPALTMTWLAAVSPAVLAQTAEPVRPAVDVRSMLPSIAEPAAAASPAGTGLTRNQRKDAALEARKEGALKPAGEGAEAGEDAAARLAVKGRAAPAAPVAAPRPMAAAPATAEATPLPKKGPANASRAKKKIASKVTPARPRPAARKPIQPKNPSNI